MLLELNMYTYTYVLGRSVYNILYSIMLINIVVGKKNTSTMVYCRFNKKCF